jgi:hypothetical protein
MSKRRFIGASLPFALGALVTLPLPTRAEPAAAASSEAPSEPAPAAPKPTPDGRAALEAELSQILDELVEARARAAFLGKRLFDTTLRVMVERDGDAQSITHLRISLDGAAVHDSSGEALARGEARLFDGPVAEGMHELTVEISEHAKSDPAFENVRVERFRLKVRRKHFTLVELTLRDRSDLAEESAEGDDGDVDVRTRMRVSSHEVKPR